MIKDNENSFRPGIYRHFKGNEYQVLELALDSETQELLVVYRCTYGDKGLWVRPWSMFKEDVVVDGVVRPRFEWLSEAEETLVCE